MAAWRRVCRFKLPLAARCDGKRPTVENLHEASIFLSDVGDRALHAAADGAGVLRAEEEEGEYKFGL